MNYVYIHAKTQSYYALELYPSIYLDTKAAVLLGGTEDLRIHPGIGFLLDRLASLCLLYMYDPTEFMEINTAGIIVGIIALTSMPGPFTVSHLSLRRRRQFSIRALNRHVTRGIEDQR